MNTKHETIYYGALNEDIKIYLEKHFNVKSFVVEHINGTDFYSITYEIYEKPKGGELTITHEIIEIDKDKRILFLRVGEFRYTFKFNYKYSGYLHKCYFEDIKSYLLKHFNFNSYNEAESANEMIYFDYEIYEKENSKNLVVDDYNYYDVVEHTIDPFFNNRVVKTDISLELGYKIYNHLLKINEEVKKKHGIWLLELSLEHVFWNNTCTLTYYFEVMDRG